MERSSHQSKEQASEESLHRCSNAEIDIELQKLDYLERIFKEQEKTNRRLQSMIENQKLEFRNHDRMIDLLHHIAFNK